MKLFPHQYVVLKDTEQYNRVAYYLDMGLGKTFVGAEKMIQLGEKVNLVICQKSKVNDWVEHIGKMYGSSCEVFDLTRKNAFKIFMEEIESGMPNEYVTQHWVGVINYELAWRRKQLLQLQDFTLILDESSLIQNEKAKQTKFIMKLQPSNVILLSGTPTSGKYENLWTQCQLLGWNISKDRYDNTYVNWTLTPDDGSGMRHKIVDKDNPYKNVDRLKSKLRKHGAVFMKTEDVLDLPEQNFIEVKVDAPKEYKQFMKDDYIRLTDELELIGDTIFTKRLYARQLCSQYNKNKLDAFKDLVQSTQDRLIVFYNFNDELYELCNQVPDGRTIGIVNGRTKDGVLMYEDFDDCVLFVQYQAGAMGLNLQKGNKIVYFSLPERSELFEQSKKRIHRIGQSKPCFYYILTATNTIERSIYETLKMRKDFTDDLFIDAADRMQ